MGEDIALLISSLPSRMAEGKPSISNDITIKGEARNESENETYMGEDIALLISSLTCREAGDKPSISNDINNKRRSKK